MSVEVRVVVVLAAWVTFCVSDGEVLVKFIASPLYVAVSWLAPCGSVFVVRVAMPLLSVMVPRVVAPLRKATDPVRAEAPEVTWAVRVTACPRVEGFGVEVRAVVVEYLLTGRVMVADWLAAKSASPA